MRRFLFSYLDKTFIGFFLDDFINYKLVIQSYIDDHTGSGNSKETGDFTFQYRDLTKLADLDTVPVPECIMEEFFTVLERAIISKDPIESSEKLWLKQKVQYYVTLFVDDDELMDFRRVREKEQALEDICRFVKVSDVFN